MEAGLSGSLTSEHLTAERLFAILLPYYLSIGMSREEFYHGEPALVNAYFQAEIIRLKREEAALWRSGSYVMQGFRAVLDEALSSHPKIQYPDRPIPVTLAEAEALEEERRQRELEQEKAAFAAFVSGWKKKQNGGQQ